VKSRLVLVEVPLEGSKGWGNYQILKDKEREERDIKGRN